jgi:hypothetical protein
MVRDMDPHQKTSIILGKPFLKSVRATIENTRGIINMKVDRVHENFIYHPKNLVCCYQIQVYRFTSSRRVRCVELLPKHIKCRPQSWNIWLYSWMWCPGLNPLVKLHALHESVVPAAVTVLLGLCNPPWRGRGEPAKPGLLYPLVWIPCCDTIN